AVLEDGALHIAARRQAGGQRALDEVEAEALLAAGLGREVDRGAIGRDAERIAPGVAKIGLAGISADHRLAVLGDDPESGLGGDIDGTATGEKRKVGDGVTRHCGLAAGSHRLALRMPEADQSALAVLVASGGGERRAVAAPGDDGERARSRRRAIERALELEPAGIKA